MRFMTNEQRGIFYAIASGLCYGLMGYFGISIVESGSSVYNMMFWRFFSSSIFMILISLKYGSIKESSKQLLRAAFIGGLIYCPGSVAYFFSGKAIGTGLAMVIFFIYPAIVVILNRLMYKTRIYRTYYLAVGIILLGMILLADIGEKVINWPGIAFAVASATSYAIYIVLSKNNSISPITSTLMVSLGCAGTALVWALIDKSFFMPTTLIVWADIFGLGIICTAIPILLLLESMKYISSEKASILSVTEPVFTIVFGMILLGETISISQVIGVTALLVGALATLLPKKLAK